jgi:valyl-tRNA synthetase
MTELSKHFDPAEIQAAITQRWLAAHAFRAVPDGRANRYVVMMPLPNVTGALHMGHAMDNVMQDLLVRWHRMQGDNTLWMAGTDHAGIATQAVVEKRLFELEGKTRKDVGREALVERIWAWKEQCQKRIIEQLGEMGASCDWERVRFTMDAVCTRAVRHCFFAMFRDGLIYRGNRLVNWDCHLETAVSDDEIVHETVSGHFYHLRYPILSPRPGEPEHVVVATTRPETMLGDTAVACHPDPDAALARLIAETRERLGRSREREREALEHELARLEARRETHLPKLRALAAMARDGRKIRLPLQEREIPLICDELADPSLGSGCVKITPAHDPNDYEVWKRHPEIGLINLLNPDGTLNENAGAFAGRDRFEARKQVHAELDRRGLVERVEEREYELGHSDRSKTPIEPYLSLQWFVRMGDVPGGVTLGRGTPKQHKAVGLAQAAIDAVSGEWRSPTGRKLAFHPDSTRYASTYLNWLGEKRDWCISRQLWWGHRIPVWSGKFEGAALERALAALAPHLRREDVHARAGLGDASLVLAGSAHAPDLGPGEHELYVSLRDDGVDGEVAPALEAAGFVRDPDVLDTWFSSGLWPQSTLGWPDSSKAEVDPGQLPLDGCLDYYYPGSCLVTGRDIITLWVARMVIMGLYNLGDLPFTDCFIHANILDGNGVRMSKTKGNGIDPVQIIQRYGADAMRYVICDLQTGSQDIRLPVQAISPFTGNPIELATAQRRGTYTYLCPETGREFDVLGNMPDVPTAELVSDRFESGRAFCTKLWNAGRFALRNLEDAASSAPVTTSQLAPEDRWILARLSRATAEVQRQLEAYNPSAALGAARTFFWDELCDWYLELAKPRLREPEQRGIAQRVLATALDQVLRLLHPFVPFITEQLWGDLGQLAPQRGVGEPLAVTELVALAPWPRRRPEWEDAALEEQVAWLQDVIREVRSVRSRYNVPPRQALDARVRAERLALAPLRDLEHLLRHMAQLSSVEISPDATRSATAATAVVRGVEIYLEGVIDLEAERARLSRQSETLAKDIDRARQKLANPKFVEKAKPDVVATERARLAELEAEQARVQESLAAL